MLNFIYPTLGSSIEGEEFSSGIAPLGAIGTTQIRAWGYLHPWVGRLVIQGGNLAGWFQL